MSNDIIAIVPNFTLVNAGAIFRGKSGKELKIEFKDDQKTTVIKERLVEAKSDGSIVFKKVGETAKTSAELIKEGKPPIKPKDEGDVGGKIK